MKKIGIAVLAVAVVAFFVVMNINPTCSTTAKLADDYQWTSASYEFLEGEEADLEITIGEDNKIKIKGPNEEMRVLITFKDDKNNKAEYEYMIYWDETREGNATSLEPLE